MPSTRFIAKIYDKTGATFKGTIPSESMLDLPSITREVSKPSSDITLSLALPWDNFGYGTKINEFFLVKLYAVNENHPSGTLVYQGFITEINPSSTHRQITLSSDCFRSKVSWEMRIGSLVLVRRWEITRSDM